jgi:heptose I phosphotransferase
VKLYLDSHWQKRWHAKDPFAEAMALQGKIYRSKEGRRTLRFECDGQGYFLKLHEGIGWGEIFKNLLQLRMPVLGAANEYHACLRLKELAVDTMTPVAFGEKGHNPASQLSFLITEELANTISLEDVCKRWREHPPSLREKRALIRKIATISKTLHDNGVNHRDYYLCHFLRADDAKPFTANDPLYLIDLHRAQIRKSVPVRWRVKDIAGLFYSAFDVELTRRDVLCFLAIYRREWLCNPADRLLLKVSEKAVALYRKDFQRNPPDHIARLIAPILQKGK